MISYLQQVPKFYLKNYNKQKIKQFIKKNKLVKLKITQNFKIFSFSFFFKDFFYTKFNFKFKKNKKFKFKLKFKKFKLKLKKNKSRRRKLQSLFFRLRRFLFFKRKIRKNFFKIKYFKLHRFNRKIKLKKRFKKIRFKFKKFRKKNLKKFLLIKKVLKKLKYTKVKKIKKNSFSLVNINSININSVNFFNYILLNNPVLFSKFKSLNFKKNWLKPLKMLNSGNLNKKKFFFVNYFLIFFIEKMTNRQIFFNFVQNDLNKLGSMEHVIVGIWSYKIKRFERIFNFRLNTTKFLKVLYKVFLNKDLELFWNLINVGIRRLPFKKHKIFFRFIFFCVSAYIREFFQFLNIWGLNFEIRGKIFKLGKARKKKIFLSINKNSKSSYYLKTKYLNKPNKTKAGALGMKFWLYYKY